MAHSNQYRNWNTQQTLTTNSQLVFLHNGPEASFQSQPGFLAFSDTRKPTHHSPWVRPHMVWTCLGLSCRLLAMRLHSSVLLRLQLLQSCMAQGCNWTPNHLNSSFSQNPSHFLTFGLKYRLIGQIPEQLALTIYFFVVCCWDTGSMSRLWLVPVHFWRSFDFYRISKIEENFNSHFSACYGLFSIFSFKKKRNLWSIIGTLNNKALVLLYQSNGTIPGQRFTKTEHTFIILSIVRVDASSDPLGLHIKKSVGRVPLKMVYFLHSTWIRTLAMHLVPSTSTGSSCSLPLVQAGIANCACLNIRDSSWMVNPPICQDKVTWQQLV